MALTLCSNCRLPVNSLSQRCQCGAVLRGGSAAVRHAPMAAAIAVAATTLALLARRRFAT